MAKGCFSIANEKGIGALHHFQQHRVAVYLKQYYVIKFVSLSVSSNNKTGRYDIANGIEHHNTH